MQRNWIGRSEGAEITFEIQDQDPLTIYTTRPDTLFGVTYFSCRTTHPLVKNAAENNPALQQFIEESRNIKVAEADMATMEKRGMPLGIYARHPLTGRRHSNLGRKFCFNGVWLCALMAVPAHDERDFEFAVKYHLPIKQVVTPEDNSHWDFTKEAFTDAGLLVNSAEFTGMTSKDASRAIIDHLESHHIGQRKINFRLRDWAFHVNVIGAHQFLLLIAKKCGAVPVPEKDLPVVLPEDVEFSVSLPH